MTLKQVKMLKRGAAILCDSCPVTFCSLYKDSHAYVKVAPIGTTWVGIHRLSFISILDEMLYAVEESSNT